MNKRDLLKATAGAALMAITSATSAQESFPSRTVTIIVPYAAGGPTDSHARILAIKLAEIWGQPVVVENRGGAATLIGTQYVSRAPADGHTLLMASYTYTSNPILRRSMPFPPDAIAPLALLGTNDLLLFVSNASGLTTIKDVVERAMAAPGKLKIASSGNASSPHIALELFGKTIGAQITHLPYKGAGPAKNDLIGGVVDGLFDGISSMQYARSGRLRAIAIAAPERHPAAPEVPTFRELGVDLTVDIWYGLLMAGKTSPERVARLNAGIRTALQDPGVKASLGETGLRLRPGTPEQFADYLHHQSRSLQALVDSGVKIDVDQ